MRSLMAIALLFSVSEAHAQTLHIVSAGVDVYHKGEKPDSFGVGARQIAKTFADHTGLKVSRRIFAGEKATKEKVLAALDRLKDTADPYDLAFVYIGTHGGNGKKKGFQMMLAGSQDDDRECLTGAGLAEAVNKIPCRVVLAVDSCHSGAVLDSPMPRAIVFCSSRRNELTYGDDFINAMKRGAEGAADTNKDGTVSFQELMDYLPGRVSQVSNGKQNPISKK